MFQLSSKTELNPISKISQYEIRVIFLIRYLYFGSDSGFGFGFMPKPRIHLQFSNSVSPLWTTQDMLQLMVNVDPNIHIRYLVVVVCKISGKK